MTFFRVYCAWLIIYIRKSQPKTIAISNKVQVNFWAAIILADVIIFCLEDITSGYCYCFSKFCAVDFMVYAYALGATHEDRQLKTTSSKKYWSLNVVIDRLTVVNL